MDDLREKISQLADQIEARLAQEPRFSSELTRLTSGFGSELGSSGGLAPQSDARLALEASLLNLRAMLAITASIGECQEDDPYAEIRYEFRGGKQYRCCTHRPQHCFEVK